MCATRLYVTAGNNDWKRLEAVNVREEEEIREKTCRNVITFIRIETQMYLFGKIRRPNPGV